LKPKVAGTACWPCVRAGITMSALRSARSAIDRRICRIRSMKMACACRSTSRSPVCTIFWVVAPQCTQPPAGSPTTRDSSHTSGTMVWPVRLSASSMRARSSSSSFAWLAICSAQSFGTMPRSACARASAASTSSQACQRFSSV
jgi:hypothetical protein